MHDFARCFSSPHGTVPNKALAANYRLSALVLYSLIAASESMLPFLVRSHCTSEDVTNSFCVCPSDAGTSTPVPLIPSGRQLTAAVDHCYWP